MGSHAAMGRAELVAALRAVPPGSATLCTGWTALDLAAHLVTRERRPDTMPGLLVPALAGWTDRVRSGYARRPYPELIRLIADGPPWTSAFALPGVDSAANTVEFLVHTEDVLRAQPGWEPRDLPADRRDAVWAGLRRSARLLLRRSPVPVVLARPEGDEIAVAGSGRGSDSGRGSGSGPDGGGPVRVTGDPVELLLLVSGRREHARVTIEGPPDAVRAFTDFKPSL